VQTRAAPRRRRHACHGDQPVESLFDRNVAQRQASRVNEHRISFRTGPATRQIALQAGYRRVVQRRQASFPELGLADQQAVVSHVGDGQLQRFGDPQSGDREQRDQCRIGPWTQAAFGAKPKGAFDQPVDLRRRVNVRRAPRLAGAEVIDWGQFMPGVFNPDVTREATDGLQPGVALRYGRPVRRPFNCGLRMDMRLPALGRKGGKALEQPLRIQHRESGGAAERQIRLDGLQHQKTSGQGCAICFRSATSALA